jgi:hypothetical protein
VRCRRLDLGLTLEEAAIAIGTTKSLLHQWEKDCRWPTLAWRHRLGEFLGFDPSSRFGGQARLRRRINDITANGAD